MTLQVSVPGGTHAGWRTARMQRRIEWRCPQCGARNRYYWLRCANCNHPRPEEE